jgi:Bifunctional DNA primase/polymerase, N-terminal/Primase C terminal 1 (PriCT-1)
MGDMGAAAQAYARLGFRVFPLWPIRLFEGWKFCGCPKGEKCPSAGKHPMTAHGVNDATSDEAKIAQWWKDTPIANIGIACGDIVVIDIDPRHGGNRALEELEGKHGKLPATPQVVTGGGGRHFYFYSPQDAVIKNSAGLIAPGVDVRGQGGYVAAPPSLHASGKHYIWAADLASTPIAEVPAWILELIEQAQPSAAVRTSSTTWRTLIGVCVEGSRNDTTTKLAGHLLRRYCDPHVALDLLIAWNATRCQPPLPDSEVVGIVNSIARKELARRRSEP